MERKQEIMIALGAAVGANCIPCFDFLYAKGREAGMDDAEIKKVVDIAFKVKNGAATFLKNAVEELAGEIGHQEQTCCEAFNNACCSDG